VWKTLGDVAQVVGGSTPDTKNLAYWGGSIAWLAVSDLSGYTEQYIERGARTITQAGFDSCGTHLVPEGTVLFSSRAPIGYVAIASGPVCTSQGYRSFVPGPEISSEFLYWYLKSIKPLAEAAASGTTFKELSGKAAARLPIPVPPLEVQEQIVERVAELTAQVDIGRADVAPAVAALDDLDEAVIDAAFAEVAAAHETAPLGDVIERLTSGSRDWKPYYHAGTGVFVLAQNVRMRRLDFATTLHVDPPADDSSRVRSAIRKDDVLVTIVGAGTGTVARVPEDFNEHYVCQSVALIRPKQTALEGAFLELFLSARNWGQHIFGQLMYGQGRPHLGFAEMKRITVPLPPLDIQRAVVERVFRQLGELSELRAPITALLDEADALKRAIIGAAFRGELTRSVPAETVRNLENQDAEHAGAYQ
jgi:type I restriction enzyme S subunit